MIDRIKFIAKHPPGLRPAFEQAKLEPGCCLSSPGVDWGCTPTLEFINDACAVVHVPGHNYWSGRGMRSYAPASRLIVGVLTRDDTSFSGERLAEYDTKRSK